MTFNSQDGNMSWYAPSGPRNGMQHFPQQLQASPSVIWVPLPLPNIFEPNTDAERMFDIDQQALANLRPLDTASLSQALGSTESAKRPLRSPLTPLTPISEGRRHSVASPISPTGINEGTLGPVSPPPNLHIQRRRSTPIAPVGLRPAHERRSSLAPGHFCVVPRKLERPDSPIHDSSGREIWWPSLPNGDIKVYVLVTSQFGLTEKFTKHFHVGELQAPVCGVVPVIPGVKPDFDAGYQPVEPGRYLPIPESVPQTRIAASRYGRRSSTGGSLGPVPPCFPHPGRRGSRQGFPAEYLDKDLAITYLPVLRSILLQTKRPIQWYEAIHVPLPYPSAWAETVEYISTLGQKQLPVSAASESMKRNLLSESVRRNLLHLGGRP